jgi:hypothetical protein
LPLAVDHFRPIKLDVNLVDDLLGVDVGLGEMPRDAFHVGAMLLVKFPPAAFVSLGAGDRHEKVVGLYLAEEFSDVL